MSNLTKTAAQIDAILNGTFTGSSSLASVGTESKLTADGTFDSNSGWTVTAGWAISGGKATHTSGVTALTGTSTMLSGMVYKLAITISGRTAGSLNVKYGTYDTGVDIALDGTHYIYGICSPTTTLVLTPTTDFNGSIETVTLVNIIDSTPELSLTASNGTSSIVDIRNGGDGYNIGIGKYSCGSVIPDPFPSGAKDYSGPASPYRGISNIGIGDRALRSVVTGKYNVAIGQEAMLKLTTGYNNVGIGDSALNFCATGYSNVAIGHEVMGRCVTGWENTCIGAGSAYALTIGKYNCSLGYGTFLSLTTGQSNIAIGRNSQAASTTASNNVSIGTNSLTASTVGNNTSLGYASATILSTGTGNITVGYGAATGATSTNAPLTDDYGILIGYNANRSIASATKITNYIGIGKEVLVGKSNQVVIGNSSITEMRLYGKLVMDEISAGLTDGTPTDAEIDTATGLTPATAGAGYQVTIKDNAGTGLLYRVESDGTDWYYSAGYTKAL